MFLCRVAKRLYRFSIPGGLIRSAWTVPALLALLSLLGALPGPPTRAEEHPAGAASTLSLAGGSPLASYYAKLTADDGELHDALGYGLAVSGDIIVAGAHNRAVGGNLGQGAALVFVRDSGGSGAWRRAAELIDVDGEQWDGFGSKVAVSGDTVVVGNSSQEAACIFGRDQGGPGAWGLVTRLTSGSVGGEAFGSSVAIDGDTIFVGALAALVGDQVSQGAVYVFARDQGGPDAWGQVARLVSAEGRSDQGFGTALAVSGDTLVVAARWERVDGVLNQGAAYVFARGQGGPGDWVQVARLTGDDGDVDQEFGLDVAVDGDTIAVSAPFAGGLQGAVHVFGRNQDGPGAWGRVTRLTCDSGPGWMHFGIALALRGEILLVTEGKVDWLAYATTGAVHVLARNWGGTDAWGQLARLTADDGTADDRFGQGLDMSEDTISVGAPGATIGNQDQGAVYLFEHMEAVGRVYLPFVVRNSSDQVCEENLEKVKVWEGELYWGCDTVVKKVGQSSLRLETDVFSDAEIDSPLIPVTPGQVYRVSYWVKTDLVVDNATVYGRIVAAQYSAQAQEGDAVNENRIDSGFLLGENVGGTTDWVQKSYTFTTTAQTHYVRLRAPMGLSGRAKGRVWFDGVSLAAVTK